MVVPVWLTLLVATVVILFGGFRIYLATKRPDPEGRGFYKMKQTTHAFVGIIYLLLGAALIATSFGWRPLSG